MRYASGTDGLCLERKNALDPDGGEDFDVAVEDALADRPAKRSKPGPGTFFSRYPLSYTSLPSLIVSFVYSMKLTRALISQVTKNPSRATRATKSSASGPALRAAVAPNKTTAIRPIRSVATGAVAEVVAEVGVEEVEGSSVLGVVDVVLELVDVVARRGPGRRGGMLLRGDSALYAYVYGVRVPTSGCLCLCLSMIIVGHGV